MSKQLIIIGAGGHGRVAADIARLRGYRVDFLDDQMVANVNRIGVVADFAKYVETADFFVGIGSNPARKAVSQRLEKAGARIVNLIHPAAVVAEDVVLGKGVLAAPGAVINTGSRIEDGVIINTCASVDHDCLAGAFSHISVGSHLAGTVTVGELTMIGAGATVINNITVCDSCMIGAGAVVTKNIDIPGTYIGVPAKQIK